MEPRSHSLLRHKIEEAIEERAVHIVSGSAKDYAHYQHDTGFVDGLRTALKLLDETNKDIAGGN